MCDAGGSLNTLSIDAAPEHMPVLLSETLGFLSGGGPVVDATIGLGGHAEAILASLPDVELIGIDQDPDAIAVAAARLARFDKRVRIVKANFAEIAIVLRDTTDKAPTAIFADLGVSSMQLDSDTRGFSFRFDSPLDMRMDAGSGRRSAADLLAEMKQDELTDIIYQFGEERHSRRIARWIIEKRENGEPITTTRELAELVRRAVPGRGKDKIHPATRTFQALRIAVNGELDVIEPFISDSIDLLKTDGVLAIITFHSLEDRIVKRAFQRFAGRCQCPPRLPECRCGAEKRVEILTRKPIVASELERDKNPRSRSAKLRACQKIS